MNNVYIGMSTSGSCFVNCTAVSQIQTLTFAVEMLKNLDITNSGSYPTMHPFFMFMIGYWQKKKIAVFWTLNGPCSGTHLHLEILNNGITRKRFYIKSPIQTWIMSIYT